MNTTIVKYFRLFVLVLATSIFTMGCEEDQNVVEIPTIENEFNAGNNVLYVLSDQMARPAINTVFVSSNRKDEFNTTIPSEMGANFASAFEGVLAAFGYQTNVLGLDAAGFAGVLATDVLNVNTQAATAFGALNGRTLADDVIDTELTLIFGGADGAGNPGLTGDNVDANDAAFSSSFPYLAAPW